MQLSCSKIDCILVIAGLFQVYCEVAVDRVQATLQHYF